MELAKLRIANQKLQQLPPVLSHDPALPYHEFGPKLICLCVTLARTVELRASITCLEIAFEWLEVDVRLPAWTTVRTWLMRLGVAALEAPVEQADDWIWRAHHSNQIGQEKALAVIGLRASSMPPQGVTIRHQDVRMLMLEPGTHWKTADMSNACQRLAKKAGQPLAVLTDGACELHEGAQTLKTGEKHACSRRLQAPCRQRSEESGGWR